MNSRILFGFIALLAVLAFSGCDDFSGREAVYLEGTTVLIPEECAEFKSDVCGLYSCMVDLCWCEEGPDRILQLGLKEIKSADGAKAYVAEFVESRGSEFSDVRAAVRLNDVFFNVFVFNESGDKMVFAVAADGAIFKTVCGV